MKLVSLNRVFPLFMVVIASCLAPPVESPATDTIEERRIYVPQTARNKVDILFMVDNSDSMKPKQDELKARFPQLIQQLRDFASRGLPAWYHLGVVTSDLGAGASNSCAKGGDGGRLNVTDRSDPKQPKSCGLGGGVSYLDFNQLDGSANVVGTVEDAFQCIASVGVAGCGFEHQLESVYQALTANTAENQGFLRDDAALVVVFLTDEDDCSAPADTDLFDQTKSGTDYSQPGNYGPLDSFRCTQFGILSNGAPLPWPMTGNFTNLSPAPLTDGPGPGKLFSIDRYSALFTADRAHGGLKDRPEDDLLVIGISAPAAPFRTLLSDPSTTGPYQPCGSYNGGKCTVVLDHSCQAAADANYVGDPAVRLRAAVESAANHDDGTSICDGSYDQALEKVGDFIGSILNAGCIGAPIDNPDHPDCAVAEITTTTAGVQLPEESLPWCGAPNGPMTASLPCWQLVPRPNCVPVENPKDGTKQQLGFEVKRDPNTALSGMVKDEVECAIVAASMR
jgi:hypothetical protein